jgi:hypothetical protein
MNLTSINIIDAIIVFYSFALNGEMIDHVTTKPIPLDISSLGEMKNGSWFNSYFQPEVKLLIHEIAMFLFLQLIQLPNLKTHIN